MNLLRLLTVAALAVTVYAAVAESNTGGWHDGTATAYSCHEPHPPVGCHDGVGATACGIPLQDRLYTVAVRRGIGLDDADGGPACGHWIEVQVGRRHALARVTDRTESRYDLELTYWLSRRLGSTDAGWDAPRAIRWRHARPPR